MSGIFYFGTTQIMVPFGNGFRCAGGMTQRLPFMLSQPNGSVSQQIDLTAYAAVQPGAALNFQHWHRDNGAGVGEFNLTNAIAIWFQ